jgi:hypothetical protein
MTSFWGQASWTKMMSPGEQANSTGMPPDQKCEQSKVTYPSLYEHWLIPTPKTFRVNLHDRQIQTGFAT